MKYETGTKVFSDWMIVDQIGEGETGKVYEIQTTTGGVISRAALKVIRIPSSPEAVEAAKARGMDEQAVKEYFQKIVNQVTGVCDQMCRLKGHPNLACWEEYQVIPQPEGFGWEILIRTELLTPFQNYLQGRPFNEEEIIHIGKELLNALDFCAQQGILHGNIKPENVFVSDNGQFKLGDFSVGRILRRMQGKFSDELEEYEAPEVYEKKPCGPEADMYSVGMLLYAFSNHGALPFYPPAPQRVTEEDKRNALERRMRGEEIAPPEGVENDLGAVIQKACSYQPEMRYRTAAELKSALQNILVQDAKQKNKKTVLVVVIVAVCVLLCAALLTWLFVTIFNVVKERTFQEENSIEIEMPEIEVPDPDVPEIEMPEIEVPDVTVPEIETPDFSFSTE